jgi:hypothetical protein
MQRQVKLDRIVTCKCCGGPARMWKEEAHGGTYFLECSPCQNRAPRCRTQDEAIAAWERNETAPVSQAQQQQPSIIVRRPRLSLAR